MLFLLHCIVLKTKFLTHCQICWDLAVTHSNLKHQPVRHPGHVLMCTHTFGSSPQESYRAAGCGNLLAQTYQEHNYGFCTPWTILDTKQANTWQTPCVKTPKNNHCRWGEAKIIQDADVREGSIHTGPGFHRECIFWRECYKGETVFQALKEIKTHYRNR